MTNAWEVLRDRLVTVAFGYPAPDHPAFNPRGSDYVFVDDLLDRVLTAIPRAKELVCGDWVAVPREHAEEPHGWMWEVDTRYGLEQRKSVGSKQPILGSGALNLKPYWLFAAIPQPSVPRP